MEYSFEFHNTNTQSEDLRFSKKSNQIGLYLNKIFPYIQRINSTTNNNDNNDGDGDVDSNINILSYQNHHQQEINNNNNDMNDNQVEDDKKVYI